MNEDLINRITYHLSSGGLFNPELADHLAVRNLLMECREALAQPEQEPVAWLTEKRYAQLHTAQRTWIGLTPEEIDEIIEDAIDSMDALLQTMDKLKEKNT